jgi:Transport and Golgi organisation 2
MCTVTIIPRPRVSPAAGEVVGFRLVCNRDEQRDRADAQSPRWRELSGGMNRAIWPADGEAGGTWIAADQHGLTLCLLNRNPTPAPTLPSAGLVSRGRIIPQLLQGQPGRLTGAEIAHRLAQFDLDAFAPFRLIAVDPRADGGGFIHELVWDRQAFNTKVHGVTPMCFASSGLGDHRVAVRLDLFESMVIGAGATPEAQDLFHGHSWADQTEISVMMSRAEARTVSMTHVDVEPMRAAASVRMRYRPVLAGLTRGVEVSALHSLASGGPRR